MQSQGNAGQPTGTSPTYPRQPRKIARGEDALQTSVAQQSRDSVALIVSMLEQQPAFCAQVHGSLRDDLP